MLLDKCIKRWYTLTIENKVIRGKEIIVMKAVWIITRPFEVQAFYKKESEVTEFVTKMEKRGYRVYKITDHKG